jgi:hypothetical protein
LDELEVSLSSVGNGVGQNKTGCRHKDRSECISIEQEMDEQLTHYIVQNDFTALMGAAAGKNLDNVKLLLKRGADVTLKDKVRGSSSIK